MDHIKNVQTGNITSNDTIQSIVQFNIDSIPKYSNVLVSAEKHFNDIQSTLNQTINDEPKYKEEILSPILTKNKYLFSDSLKGSPFKLSADQLSVEANQFLGYSFILIQAALTQKNIHQIVVVFEDLSKEKAQTYYQNSKELQQTCSFGLGITNLRIRSQKGYDQQDLAILGHGFYLLRSDGFVCHSSRKEINWIKDGFIAIPNETIIMTWNPQDLGLDIQQGDKKYHLPVDKPSGKDIYHFVISCKYAKCRIIE